MPSRKSVWGMWKPASINLMSSLQSQEPVMCPSPFPRSPAMPPNTCCHCKHCPAGRNPVGNDRSGLTTPYVCLRVGAHAIVSVLHGTQRMGQREEGIFYVMRTASIFKMLNNVLYSFSRSQIFAPFWHHSFYSSQQVFKKVCNSRLLGGLPTQCFSAGFVRWHPDFSYPLCYLYGSRSNISMGILLTPKQLTTIPFEKNLLTR